MIKFTFTISKALKKRMDRHPEVDWHAVALNGIALEIKLLKSVDTTNKFFRKAKAKGFNSTAFIRKTRDGRHGRT